AVGMDPLAFRLKNLRDERLIAVLEAATNKFGWPRSSLAASGSRRTTASAQAGGRGVGLACGVEKGGYTACCVEIAIGGAEAGAVRPKPDAVNVKLRRVVVAFECGAIVNPN